LKTAQATLRQSGYSSAPVSALLVAGIPEVPRHFCQAPSPAIWKLAQTYNGREVWVGAATHDIATMNSRAGSKWSHRIDPHVDREREWVETDLLLVGTGVAYADVERPAALRKLGNSTGDQIVTDGKISVVQLATPKTPNDGEIVLTPR